MLKHKLLKNGMKIKYNTKTANGIIDAVITIEQSSENNGEDSIFICSNCSELGGRNCKNKRGMRYSYYIGSLQDGCVNYPAKLQNIIIIEKDWDEKEN